MEQQEDVRFAAARMQYSSEGLAMADNDVVEMKTIYSTDDEVGRVGLEKKNLLAMDATNFRGDHSDSSLEIDYARRPPPTPRTFSAKGLRAVLFGSKLCCLLPLVPVAIVMAKTNAGHGWVFLLSLLAIAPLAERLGFVTEQLALHTSSTVGGLLNATFGNATEMIISIFALQNGMIRVVQLSLLGSILSNMLLVLGCAFFMGGLVHRKKDQKFNKAAAVVSSGLLLMAVMGLLFPAALHSTHTEVHDGKSELSLSRFSSCVLLLAYASYLFFQLVSHRQLYENEEQEEDSESNDGDGCVLSCWGGIMWLAILTVFISVLSEFLVDAINGASKAWNVPVAFISVIILPIVGNAAEHASAIMFALKDKLDISLGVAIGSSTQISMFVIPFCVVVGWIMGQPMNLDFQLFETATLFITVLVVAFMLQEGTANYFKGLMLIFCYMIVGASFFVHEIKEPWYDVLSSPFEILTMFLFCFRQSCFLCKR